jgi:tetratricopeptide (TPR) repeat protein
MPLKTTLTLILFFLTFNAFAQTNSFEAADKLYDSKDYQASLKICTNELQTLTPTDSLFSKFLRLRVDNYRELNDFTLAIYDCIELIKINPQKTSNYLNISYLYGSINDFDNCLKSLNTAIQINPKDVGILNNLSYYSNQINKFDDGIKYADTGLSLTTDSMWLGTLLNNRGFAKIGIKKYDDALIDINKALKYIPDNSYAYAYRALANIDLNKLETVCDDLKKAKDLGAVSLTSTLRKEYCKDY